MDHHFPITLDFTPTNERVLIGRLRLGVGQHGLDKLIRCELIGVNATQNPLDDRRKRVDQIIDLVILRGVLLGKSVGHPQGVSR